jgi:hypothetical protein
MKPKEVKEAIESLQKFLLDEYGMDTKAPSNETAEETSQSESNTKFGMEYLNAYLDKPRKAANRS